MELKIEQISPYLPYKLRCKVQGEENTSFEFQGVSDCTWIDLHEIGRTVNHQYDIEDVYPILRPLKLLSKHDLDFMYFEIINTDNDMYGSRMEFDDWFNETDIYHLPICLYNYLLENHFDVFGLIDNKLAVSISCS